MKRLENTFRLSVGLVLCVAVARAQDRAGDQARELDYARAHYTKYDFKIPMRDGAKLFTSVYAPKDTTQAYPILMIRTPYSVGPYGIDNYPSQLGPSESFMKEGFIFVSQDVRGRYLSEGAFIDVPPHKTDMDGPKETDESTDTYDTIDWLVKNVPNNNGRVGIWGVSYPGFYAAFGLIHAHPALKAASPQAPMGDVGNGDDAYHNGAFHLAANFGFYTGFKPRGPEPKRPESRDRFDFGTPDAYEFYLRMGPLANANELYLKNANPYWNDVLAHPAYDEYWASRAEAPHIKGITTAVLFVGGWFDAEDLSGPLKLFRAVERDGHAPANTLVMGPWRHGGWSGEAGDKLGNLSFGSKTAEFFREQIELPFFLKNLKLKGDGLKTKSDPRIPKAWLFETGTDQWRRFEAWPPKNAVRRSLYLRPSRGLSFSPSAGEPDEFDEYVSDPAKPVPVTGEIGPGMPGDYMTYDQRFASRRTDVLAYETEPLDHDVTIAGPITPVLRVSSSGTDSDFIVKLIDVYPNDYPDPKPNPAGVHLPGYQQLVRGEPFRAKYARSMSHPEPLQPGEPVGIEFTMPDVLHTFRPGHRIMVQIQSSWFPLVDRNPQQFVEIPKAKASDFQAAVERVYRGGEQGSRLDFLVMKSAQASAGTGLFDANNDVGAPLRPGSVEFDASAGRYLVSGGGANMWATNDAFQYVWKKVSGDVTLAADIAFVGTGGEAHKKACLVIRQSLDPDSAYADAAVHGVGLTALQYRSAKGSITQQIQSKVSAPRRLRIEKRGNTITVSVAAAGEELHALDGSVEIAWKDPFYVGLAVCAHNTNNLEQAVFSKVELK